MAKSKSPTPHALTVAAFKHDEAKRTNIPTAEYQSVMREADQKPIPVSYPRHPDADPLTEEKARRNRDLDPQLVWRGKDQQDWSDLVVHAPPLYIQEKVHPKALIDDLLHQSAPASPSGGEQLDFFADFNGLPEDAERTDFYQHAGHWSNRMILGDSLQVMASLAEREGLRGKVQCIYLDPPYGIKFNSNFQWSTTSRDVKDGNPDHITREPEQVKAFRDTWRDGIHSYLTYLRDRLTVARDLLTESGSIFVQIGDENVHRVRAVMDEVFGQDNFMSLIAFLKTSSSTTNALASTSDYLVWYTRDKTRTKFRAPTITKVLSGVGGGEYRSVMLPSGETRRLIDDEVAAPHTLPENSRVFRLDTVTSQSPGSKYTVEIAGRRFFPSGYWKTEEPSMKRLIRAGRIVPRSNSLGYLRFFDDYGALVLSNTWTDTQIAGRPGDKIYVVQTLPKVIQRCLLMSTDPGDLVLDPTCGSGTTAYVAEQWGRRWITIDTSRVALALARARLMGARYPYYLLADSRAGQLKEAEITQSAPSTRPTDGHIGHGFVYERVPHITLKSIANNAEIDVIWDKWQETLEPLRARLNQLLAQTWEEWEIPREAGPDWPDPATQAHAQWWQARIARQREIDASIAAKADFESLYDKPYEDKKTVRVAGPFTVESLSPHRVLGLDENDDLIDPVAEPKDGYGEKRDFVAIILENLKTAGVQQAHKTDRIAFTSLTPWPGRIVCAEGRFSGDQWPLAEDATTEKRAAIFIGPEFGTVSRPDLVEAACEAGDAGFDLLIACAFNYDAHSSEFDKLGRIPVLKARMNADLHMAEDLKNTGKGNLFVVFGEPDIEIQPVDGELIRVKVNGVDVFHPSTGEVRSDGAEGIACWFIDTDYNQEAFFVRHAYFLGTNDPYKSLKTTLKAEIDLDAWASLHSDTSRPFPKPASGRIAVKVINHLGDEVMKVFRIG
ncbi:site-specific DNA-methyltransferase [Thiobaca trueperi]|uniref:site-specific DNA-methyltransferase (adenine-specific) n=1 Tax=Thiobaca trueperi TaxID=127458 RepID=A0A4R3N1X5_9GAMM|nr:site-specific DNA-methyltransferase [Thiobaca trueperi]TCT20649.1 adenine-specific DNA-methyltransferase [Thiobaca trueperi]